MKKIVLAATFALTLTAGAFAQTHHSEHNNGCNGTGSCSDNGQNSNMTMGMGQGMGQGQGMGKGMVVTVKSEKDAKEAVQKYLKDLKGYKIKSVEEVETRREGVKKYNVHVVDKGKNHFLYMVKPNGSAFSEEMYNVCTNHFPTIFKALNKRTERPVVVTSEKDATKLVSENIAGYEGYKVTKAETKEMKNGSNYYVVNVEDGSKNKFNYVVSQYGHIHHGPTYDRTCEGKNPRQCLSQNTCLGDCVNGLHRSDDDKEPAKVVINNAKEAKAKVLDVIKNLKGYKVLYVEVMETKKGGEYFRVNTKDAKGNNFAYFVSKAGFVSSPIKYSIEK